MSGWDLMYRFVVVGVGVLTFLSIVADELDRASADMQGRRVDRERRRRVKQDEHDAVARARARAEARETGEA